MLPFTFFTGNLNEPEKGSSWTWKVLLSLVKTIWQWCQEVILTGLLRRGEGVPGSNRLQEKLQHQSDRKSSRRLMWAWRGMASLGSCFTTQNNTKRLLGACVRELRGPVLVLLHTSWSTRKKGEPTQFADPSYHSTPRQNRKENVNVRDEEWHRQRVFPLKMKQKDWMTESIVTYCLGFFRQHLQNVNDFQLLLFHDGFVKAILLLQLYLTFFSKAFSMWLCMQRQALLIKVYYYLHWCLTSTMWCKQVSLKAVINSCY